MKTYPFPPLVKFYGHSLSLCQARLSVSLNVCLYVCLLLPPPVELLTGTQSTDSLSSVSTHSVMCLCGSRWLCSVCLWVCACGCMCAVYSVSSMLLSVSPGNPVSRKFVTLSRNLIYSFVIWDTKFPLFSCHQARFSNSIGSIFSFFVFFVFFIFH